MELSFFRLVEQRIIFRFVEVLTEFGRFFDNFSLISRLLDRYVGNVYFFKYVNNVNRYFRFLQFSRDVNEGTVKKNLRLMNGEHKPYGIARPFPIDVSYTFVISKFRNISSIIIDQIVRKYVLYDFVRAVESFSNERLSN